MKKIFRCIPLRETKNPPVQLLLPVRLTVLFLLITFGQLNVDAKSHSNTYCENPIGKTIVGRENKSESQPTGEFVSIEVRGTVTDSATGNPLTGASVKLKGSAIGTATDENGKFSLNAPENGVLEVSYTGYSSKEIAINGRTSLEITLASSATELEQLVVVGYEKQRRKDLTGAISTISAKDLVMSSAPDIGHMLEGKIPDLYIQQNSAQPGGGLNLLIRGGGSINASNAPLIVIDGFPISDIQQPGSGGYYNGGTFSVLNSLNPNDVESVTVLKDASATAIYGSRAANGVILVTTKSGHSGKPTVRYSADYSAQPYVNKFKELSLSQWMQVYNDAAWENWLWTNQVQPWGPIPLKMPRPIR